VANRRTGSNLPAAGRGSKLTPSVREQICESIRDGNWPKVAAQAAGVTPQTLFNWQKWGREDRELGRTESIYFEFLEALACAEAEAEVAGVEHILKAGEKDWRAEPWFLERRFPDRWVPRQTVTVEEAAYSGKLDSTVVQAPEMVPIVSALMRKLAAGAARPRLTDGRPE
jgi:transposase-like protein